MIGKRSKNLRLNYQTLPPRSYIRCIDEMKFNTPHDGGADRDRCVPRKEGAFCFTIVDDTGAWGTKMAKKTMNRQPWTKEDIRMLESMVREKTKTNLIARRLKRSVAATYQKAMRLGVTMRARGRKGA